jgi:DNA recombination protein RmuC
VELAGLTPHVDFQEQTRQDENQPDMLIHMPNNAVLPVDAKTTLQSFREVAEASDDAARKLKLKAHAAVLKGRIAELSRKEYWRQFEGRNPEFVVLFLPHEGFLSAAFEGDPAILEAAFKERILLVTPITLLALLRTVAYGWQQRAMTENAREIADQGRELHERARIFLEHIAKLGGAIEATTRQYNQAIGSLETRLMPTLRKLKDLGAGAADLPEPATADTQPRLPRAEPGPS